MTATGGAVLTRDALLGFADAYIGNGEHVASVWGPPYNHEEISGAVLIHYREHTFAPGTKPWKLTCRVGAGIHPQPNQITLKRRPPAFTVPDWWMYVTRTPAGLAFKFTYPTYGAQEFTLARAGERRGSSSVTPDHEVERILASLSVQLPPEMVAFLQGYEQAGS